MPVGTNVKLMNSSPFHTLTDKYFHIVTKFLVIHLELPINVKMKYTQLTYVDKLPSNPLFWVTNSLRLALTTTLIAVYIKVLSRQLDFRYPPI